MNSFDNYDTYKIAGKDLKDVNKRYLMARTWCIENIPKPNWELNINYHFSNKLKDGEFIIYFHKDVIEYYIQFKLIGF